MPLITRRLFPSTSRSIPPLLLLLLALPTLLCAAAGDDVIRRVQAKFQSLKSLSVRFVMNYQASDATKSSFEGRVFLGGSGQFRMESSAQTIVSDGKILWSYSPEEKQLMIYDAVGGDTSLLTPRQLLFDYPDKYKVQSVKQAKLDGLTCDLLAMTPKDPSDPTKSLKIWVDRKEGLTRRFQIEDLSDAVTTFDFKDFQVGKPLHDSTFMFTSPVGVEVIDMREKK